MDEPRILPNLFLVGAPKAGTTTVQSWLAQHPDVFFPPSLKEPAFFAGFHGQTWSGPGAARFRECIVGSEEEYLSLYAAAGDFCWRGDASSDYLWCPAAPAAIKASCGSSVKVLVVLRDPVTRAFSEHCHLVRDGLEKSTLQEAFGLEDKRREAGWQPLFYHRQRGLYAAPLERYFSTFGRERVKVVLYEDLERDPRAFMREVFEFLNVAPIEFSPTERHNASGETKSHLFRRMLQANHKAKTLVKRLLGEERARRIRLAFERMNTQALELSDADRVFLRALFAEEVARVKATLERDLSAWTRDVPKGAVSHVDVARQPRRVPKKFPGRFWGVVSYYNPAGYATKLNNFRRFADGVRTQGLKLLVVELAHGDAPFAIPESLCDIVVRRRSDCVLWHKERLLNIGVSRLPSACDKVAWLDGDIVFENDSWVTETAQQLESFVVVQPYETACWLPDDNRFPASESWPFGDHDGRCMPGMAWSMNRVAHQEEALEDYFLHGHTGFAWTIRRHVLTRHGLFDRQILGGADLVVAHALYDDEAFRLGNHSESRCFSPRQLEAVDVWSRGFARDVQGSVSSVPGRVLHLWHGRKEDRQYGKRRGILKQHDFDVREDIRKDDSGCWEWASDKPQLHAWIRDYFFSRNEDPGD